MATQFDLENQEYLGSDSEQSISGLFEGINHFLLLGYSKKEAFIKILNASNNIYDEEYLKDLNNCEDEDELDSLIHIFCNAIKDFYNDKEE